MLCQHTSAVSGKIKATLSDMSQLLGRQDCIESLRRDLVDLQGAILDVFSRTGPVRFSSWKFPDKLSCNLDMVALLEQYDFVEGEDAFSQHSHIVLLELVIDRLLLLLQSFNTYVDQNRSSHKREMQQKGCLSVGLIVRNYWSNLVQHVNVQGANKDFKNHTKANGDCDETRSASSVRHCLSAASSTSSFKFLPQTHAPTSPNPSTPCHPKADCVNVGCQTFESSLVPCDACHQVQSLLRKTGHALVELFQSEGLPSSLEPLLAAVEDTLELGHMTAGDVAQWANEQLRDTRRLAKHLQDVRGTVKPLEDRLAAAEAERERLRSQLEKAQKEFKQEMEKHQVNTVQLEFSLRKAERCVKEMEHKLHEEQQQYRKEITCLEERNSRIIEKVAAQQDTLQALEYEKTTLQEKVRTLQEEEQSCCKLQQMIQQLEGQISENQLHLDKERSKYLSACRQQESMQAKQESLLKRVDVLDEECEELQRQLGESEERQIVLHNELKQMSEETQQAKAQLSQQQVVCSGLHQEKLTLETLVGELQSSVSRLEGAEQALRERERLLVAFPELSPQAQPQSTGNVLLDMEQQLRANTIRIKVLEEENTTLQTSVGKLRKRAQNPATREGPVGVRNVGNLHEASPLQKLSVSLCSMPEDQQENLLAPMQKSPLQSSSATRLGSSNRRKEAGWEESGLESAGSGDRVSTASPSSLQLHFQTLHLNTGSTAAKSHKEAHSRSLLSQHRGVNQRKRLHNMNN